MILANAQLCVFPDAAPVRPVPPKGPMCTWLPKESMILKMGHLKDGMV